MLTIDQICCGIKEELVDYCKREGRTLQQPIHDQMSLDYIGLDSLSRVELLEALDQKYQVSLEPTAAYDFVTVRALAEYVHSVFTGTPLDERKALGV
jgi:acyl carrier protein